MCDLKDEFIKKIGSYDKLPLLYTDHVLKRCLERGISLDRIFQDLTQNTNLINVEKQESDKYLVTYQKRYSPKYSYVVELKQKGIEIISAWINNSKLQKKINKTKWQ